MVKQLADRILEYLDSREEVNSLELTDVFGEDHQKIVGAVKSLETVGDLITTKPVSQKRWELTSEGEHVRDHGSHEAAVYNAVSGKGTPQAEIMKSVPFAKVGFSKAMVAGWIELDKSSGTPIVKRKVETITDTTRLHLNNLHSVPENLKGEYKKRKLIQEVITKSVLLGKGPNFSTKMEKLEADLTSDLLVNGAWKEKKFKPYNFSALGSALEIGHLHPLLKVRSEFRKIFLEMGFTEMPTNNFVESSFWNFDALFQPQQHPARDAHDTFFISDPPLSSNFPPEYLERVKKVHSKGGYGSQGYRYDWRIEEAQKNLLRTHTTAVSARILYKLMQQGEFKPVKYFSIDRVFRNETLDATHLAEFHQVEGVVADRDLTLGDLIGTLYEFFSKLGITQLEFKPAYNPYTEPSMEIFCYHTGLGKWIEIGNSGMFRPEMLLPMGLPENVNVIAWGLSLERPTMIKYGLNNIRDLVGSRVDMEMVYNNPICRLDKTSRRAPTQSKQTHQSSDQTRHPKKPENQRLILFCDPEHPVRLIFPFLNLLKPHFTISYSVHVHSSIRDVPRELLDEFCAFSREHQGESDAKLSLTLIWRRTGVDPTLILPRGTEIRGQVNVARYFNRLLESLGEDSLAYENADVSRSVQIDRQLDEIHEAVHGPGDVGRMRKSVVGEEVSMVNLLLDSIGKRSKK